MKRVTSRFELWAQQNTSAIGANSTSNKSEMERAVDHWGKVLTFLPLVTFRYLSKFLNLGHFKNDRVGQRLYRANINTTQIRGWWWKNGCEVLSLTCCYRLPSRSSAGGPPHMSLQVSQFSCFVRGSNSVFSVKRKKILTVTNTTNKIVLNWQISWIQWE